MNEHRRKENPGIHLARAFPASFTGTAHRRGTYDFPDPKFQIGQLVMLNTGKSLDCYGVHCDASTIGRVKAVHTVSYIKGFVYEIECLRCGGQMYAQDKQVSTKLPDGAGIVLEEYLVAIS